VSKHGQALGEKLRPGRLLLSEGEKATLAEIAHRLGRMALADVAATAKPDTILGWYRKLIGNKFDGSERHHRRRRTVPSEEHWESVNEVANGWLAVSARSKS